jgi:hypothetical protein
LISGGVTAFVAAIVLIVLFTNKKVRIAIGVDEGAKATFKLQNAADTASVHKLKFASRPTPPDGVVAVTPSYVGVKLVAAYLSEDIDPVTWENKGATSMIYVNPICGDELAKCDVGGDFERIVTDYFEFTATTQEVNTQLNAQARTLPAGTYKYVRLEFCKYAENGNNFKFRASGMDEDHVYTRASCSVTALCEPPIVVEDGKSVTVRVTYDLTDTVWIYQESPGGANCTEGSPAYCFTGLDIVPSAEVN